MSDLVVDYEKIKKKIQNVKIPQYKEIDISKVLSIQIWKIITMSKKQILIRILGLISCRKLKVLETVNQHSDTTSLLFLESGNIRPDNMTIYGNAKQLLKPCNEIKVLLVNKPSLRLLVKKISFTLSILKYFAGTGSLLEQLYYGASMTLVSDVKEVVETLIEFQQTKTLMVFQDHEIIQNIIVQEIKIRGGITISLQHGQRVYRKVDADYMGIENFTADYTLLWNKYSQIQYMKAGYKEERLPIVGSTKYALDSQMQKINSYTFHKCEKKTIGVILDVPHQKKSHETNIKMIQFAIKFAAKYNYGVLIKPHPSHNLTDFGEYENVNNKISITPLDMSMKIFSQSISYAISHSSGASVDLIIIGTPVFIYVNEVSFPLILPNIFFFTEYEEMETNILNWSKNNNYNINEFENIRKIYFEEDSYRLHKEFFENLRIKRIM